MNDKELRQRLEELAARLERLEREVGLEPWAMPAAHPPAPTPPVPPFAPPVAPPVAPPPVQEPVPAPPLTPPTAPDDVAQPPIPIPPAAASPPKVRTPSRAQLKAAAKRDRLQAIMGRRELPDGDEARPRRNLELFFGQRALAWIGAIGMVIGTAILVKVGYDTGIWGNLTGLTKCLLIAGLGVGLLVGGEIAQRRLGIFAAVGLFGAGLGTLYLDAYSTFAFFDVATGEQAFFLMGVVAAIGFFITLRTNFLTIGVLSIVGGYLALWLVAGRSARFLEVGIYLTALFGMALGLSMFRPRCFRPLRYVALGGQGIMGAFWAVGATTLGWITVLILVSMWWVFVVIEVLVAALRGQSDRGNVAASLLSTAWYVTLGTWLLFDRQPPGTNLLGMYTAGVAVVAAAVAFQFGPTASALGRTPREAIAKLALALWAQCGVLVAVAIALQFDGYGRSIGWLAVGLASVEIGRRMALRPVEIFGLVVGGLAVAQVAFWDWHQPGMSTQLWSGGSMTVTSWSVLALVTILAVHVAARRWRRGATVPVLLALVGTLGWLALCLAQSGPLTSTAGWLAASVVLVAAARFGRRQRYLEIGLVVLAATAGKWLVADALLPRLTPGWDPSAQRPILNGQMGMALAIAAVGGWAAWSLGRRSKTETRGWSAGAQLSVVGGVVFLLIAVSFELHHLVRDMGARGVNIAWPTDQLLQLLLTMLWALGSVTLGVLARIIAGRDPDKLLKGPQLVSRFAWALLVACAVKWVIGDTLFFAVFGRTGTGVTPLFNAQMVTGLILAAGAVVLLWAVGGSGLSGRSTGTLGPAAWIPAAAAIVVLWALSFEVDRLIGRGEADRVSRSMSQWPAIQLRALWWTALWATGGLAMVLWSRLRAAPGMVVAGWSILIVAALTWLGYDTILWRFRELTLATPVFNLQFGVGVLLLALLAAAIWQLGALARSDRGSPLAAGAPAMGVVMIGLIGLWLGSLEVDRFFAPEAARVTNAATARNAVLNIYWAIYGLGMVSVGFARRWAICRYAGMALLLLAFGKALTIDLATKSTLVRALSVMALSLVLVATSIGYTKLASRVLPEEK